MTTEPTLPVPISIGGRLRFVESEVENYKRALAGLPLRVFPIDEPVKFVGANEFCDDLGINRRTLGRRVKGLVR